MGTLTEESQLEGITYILGETLKHSVIPCWISFRIFPTEFTEFIIGFHKATYKTNVTSLSA